jgi:hypothetical protein
MIGGGRETMPNTGFGCDVRAAWEARKRALAAERSLTWQLSAPGEYVSGKLVGSTQIARDGSQ